MTLQSFKKWALRSLITGIVCAIFFVIGQVATVTTLAQRPASQPGGTLWLPSDALWFSQFDGAAWHAFGPAQAISEPPLTGWTNDNGGTFDTTYGYPYFSASAAGSQQLRMEYRTAPVTTPYTCKVLIKHSFIFGGSDQRTAWGLGFRDSSGKIVSIINYTDTSNNEGWWTAKWTNSTTHSADYTFQAVTWSIGAIQSAINPMWMYIQDDGTNLNMGYSLDGNHLIQVDSRSRTDWFASGPTQVGFLSQPWESGHNMAIQLWGGCP